MYDFNFAPVFGSFGLLLEGAWLTVQMSCTAMVIGLILSIFGAVGKTSGPKPIRVLINIYIEVIRNTPFLVQLYFFFFALPALGIRFEPNQAALLALVVNFGAYGTEIVRAGVASVGKGTIEAARTVGLNFFQTLRYVILKPAMRAVYPALTSQFIYLMLASSVVSVISATDLAAAGNDLQSQTFASFEVYIVITAMYFGLSLAFTGVFALIGKYAFSYPVN
ncbi:MAG: amino acid ABC transporter permease, partial [Sulfitobacter sp.]